MITDISIIEKSKVKSKNFLTSPFIYPYLLIKSSIVSIPNKEITALKNITAKNVTLLLRTKQILIAIYPLQNIK